MCVQCSQMCTEVLSLYGSRQLERQSLNIHQEGRKVGICLLAPDPSGGDEDFPFIFRFLCIYHHH